MAFEDYSSAGLQALQGGMQIGVGLRQARLAEAVQEQEAAKLQRQRQFVTDLQAATQSGDSKAMLDVMGAYPEQADTITKMIGAKDAQHARAIGSFASQLGSMIDAGDMTGAMGLVAQNSDIITAQGRDPLQFIQQIKENPALVKQGADAMMLMTMTPDEQLSYRQKLEDQKIARERIAETARGHTITQQGQQAVASRAASGGRKASDAGLAWTQLADGRMVKIEKGKPYGAGASQFFKGYDEDGNLIRVPVSSMAAPPTSGESARHGLTSADASILMNASDKEIGAITGITGSIGSPALTADIASRLGPELRPVFSAAKRINSAMQNQGIGAARDMGASGINTVAEAKMYFASMPQLDYSSPQAFRDSLGTIDQYTKTFNTKNSAKLGGGEGKSGAKVPSYTTPPPQAAIDFLRENPQFKGAFKQKYGALPEGM